MGSVMHHHLLPCPIYASRVYLPHVQEWARPLFAVCLKLSEWPTRERTSRTCIPKRDEHDEDRRAYLMRHACESRAKGAFIPYWQPRSAPAFSLCDIHIYYRCRL